MPGICPAKKRIKQFVYQVFVILRTLTPILYFTVTLHTLKMSIYAADTNGGYQKPVPENKDRN